MKLRRREFLKSIVPALLGGKKLLEDLVSGEDPEPERTMQVDTPTGFSACAYLPLVMKGWYALPPIAPWERGDLMIESSDRPGLLVMTGEEWTVPDA